MCIEYPSKNVLYNVLDPSIFVLYSQKIHSKHMGNVDFMLSQHHRRLTYINPTLSIIQHKHNRSTPAQRFLNVGPASQTMDKRETNIGSVYRAD